MKTFLLLKPSLEEIKMSAAKMGLPEIEAEKFWNYYESVGWFVGRRKMVSFTHALAGWKIRWQEKERTNGHSTNGSGAMKVIWGKELERIIERMRVIRSGYDSHMDIRPNDRAELRTLKTRLDELKRKLEVTV